MAKKDDVRRSYDELADVYAAQRGADGRGMEILERFIESLDISTHVLDAGCGQGSPVLSFLAGTAAAIGLDFSTAQLRLAASNAPDAALVSGDLTNLPFVDDSFDGVVAYWSLIHVPLGEHQAAIDEFARVLRPGGRALVCEGTNEWVGENPDWLDSGVEMQWEIAGADATRAQLRAAGFRIDRTWGVPETLEEDPNANADADAAVDADADGAPDQADEDASDGDPWTFFDACLNPR